MTIGDSRESWLWLQLPWYHIARWGGLSLVSSSRAGVRQSWNVSLSSSLERETVNLFVVCRCTRTTALRWQQGACIWAVSYARNLIRPVVCLATSFFFAVLQLFHFIFRTPTYTRKMRWYYEKRVSCVRRSGLGHYRSYSRLAGSLFGTLATD